MGANQGLYHQSRSRNRTRRTLGNQALGISRQEGPVPVPRRKLPPHAVHHGPVLQPRAGDLSKAGRQCPEVACHRHSLRGGVGCPRGADTRPPAAKAAGRRSSPGCPSGSGPGPCASTGGGWSSPCAGTGGGWSSPCAGTGGGWSSPGTGTGGGHCRPCSSR